MTGPVCDEERIAGMLRDAHMAEVARLYRAAFAETRALVAVSFWVRAAAESLRAVRAAVRAKAARDAWLAKQPAAPPQPRRSDLN